MPPAITVQPRAGVTLSQAVDAMGVWLTDEGITPASFRPVALPRAGIAFEVAFDNFEDAALFGEEFA